MFRYYYPLIINNYVFIINLFVHNLLLTKHLLISYNLFAIYLTTLSVAQIMRRRMTE
jgi:hypothetical protein